MPTSFIAMTAGDPGLGFEHEELREILTYWELKRAKRRMPSRHDIDPIELRRHLGWIVMVDVTYTPVRFRFRLIGSAITAQLGRDSTGRFMDEIYPAETYVQVTQSYRGLLETRQPNRVLGTMQQAGKEWISFESIDLPLSEDGEQVNMILTRTIFC